MFALSFENMCTYVCSVEFNLFYTMITVKFPGLIIHQLFASVYVYLIINVSKACTSCTHCTRQHVQCAFMYIYTHLQTYDQFYNWLHMSLFSQIVILLHIFVVELGKDSHTVPAVCSYSVLAVNSARHNSYIQVVLGASMVVWATAQC